MEDEQSVRPIQASETSPRSMTPISKEQTDISIRAKYIKKQIEKNKHWHGGHSPIPSRGITAKTIKTMKQEISLEDSAALIVLLQDDAGDIQETAARLLACVNPNAQSEIAKVMAAEKTSIERRSNYRNALSIIDSIRDGTTLSLCE
jgi:hypothetical protein